VHIHRLLEARFHMAEARRSSDRWLDDSVSAET